MNNLNGFISKEINEKLSISCHDIITDLFRKFFKILIILVILLRFLQRENLFFSRAEKSEDNFYKEKWYE